MQGARARVLGVEIDRLDMDETVARCEQTVAMGRYAQQVSINAAKMVALHESAALRRIIEQCEIVNADGQSVVWASRLLRDPLPARVPGIDLMHRLFALAEQRGYGVYVLGARSDILARAMAVVSDRHPRLRIAGYHNGYFPEGSTDEVCRRIRLADAQILFVAMTSPMKEEWIARHGKDVGVNLAMGVGGAVDVLAGQTSRAPILLQRTGLEWTARVWQEPRRMLPRYTVTNAKFIRMTFREVCRRKAGGAG